MKLPSRILVGLDADDVIADAWREATAIAKTFGAELVLAHAIRDAGEHSLSFPLAASTIRDLFADLAMKGEIAGVTVSPNFVIESALT